MFFVIPLIVCSEQTLRSDVRATFLTIMDPISVTASIVGLPGITYKMSSILSSFIESAKGAPKLAQSVLVEVNDVSACLSQLQSLILSKDKTQDSREDLLMVDQIVVALSNCVLVFSDLEDIVDS